MGRGVFITGTDTGIGKTRFTVTLMSALKRQGLNVAGMKPVASGAVDKNGHLINEDAELISKYCSKPTPYELINPIVFEPPIAPHIAADLIKKPIEMKVIKNAYIQLAENNDIVVVEGIGGWRVPLSDHLSQTNLARELKLSLILVVGLRLGCINHAILTAEAIRADGIDLCGWVSNQLQKECIFKQEIKETLKERLACPCIADLAYRNNLEPDKTVEIIDLSVISRT